MPRSKRQKPRTNQRTNQQQRKVQRLSTAKPVSKRSASPLLMVVVLFLPLLAAAYWNFAGPTFQFPIRFAQHEAQEMGPEQFNSLLNRYVNLHFNMSGVRIGMTPKMVQKLYPNMSQDVSRAGDRVLTMTTRRGLLVAWLDNTDHYVKVGENMVHKRISRIYRMRLDEVYPAMTEQEILVKYGQHFGRPIEAACTRAQLGHSPRCTYNWWGGEGISIEATTKTKLDPNGRMYTLVTTTAENTLKSAKMASLQP